MYNNVSHTRNESTGTFPVVRRNRNVIVYKYLALTKMTGNQDRLRAAINRRTYCPGLMHHMNISIDDFNGYIITSVGSSHS